MSDTKIREKLSLLPTEARDIIDGDHPDFEIVRDKVIDTTRWSIVHKVIIRRKSDGKFFSDRYTIGTTERESAWAYDMPDFTEVFPVEKTIIVYD